MTLIFTVVAPEFVILAGDSRTSWNGRSVSNTTRKVGVVDAGRASLLWGFCGLARCGDFEANGWISDALAACGPPDFAIGNVLDRFADRATETFRRRRDFRHLTPSQKRFSAVFAGYGGGGQPTVALVSNFEKLTGEVASEAAQDFDIGIGSTKASTAAEGSIVTAHGALQTLARSTVPSINELLLRGVPTIAVRDKIVDVIRECAQHPLAGNSINNDVMGAMMHPSASGQSSPIALGFFKSGATFEELPILDHVVLSPLGVLQMRDAVIALQGRTPIIPHVGRNDRCPCGSGRKYKHCHGG